MIATGDPATLEHLPFEPRERLLCHVSFNFLSRQMSGQTTFDYDVLQKDEYGEPVGGERYHILVPGREGFFANGGENKSISPNTSVQLEAESIGESAIFNWYDPSGILVHTGQDLTVSPEVTTTYKLEVIAEGDGVKDYDEVEVKVKEHEIISIAPNPASSSPMVGYRVGEATSAYLSVSLPYGSGGDQYILDLSGSQVQISLNGLVPGAYSVQLVVDGTPVDQATLTVL